MIKGPLIITASILRGCWEVRAVRVDPGPGPEHDAAARGPWFLRIGGWAVPGDEPPAESAGMVAAEVSGGGLVGVVRALAGDLEPAVWRTEGNAFGRYAAIAYLETPRPVVPGVVYAAGIALTGAADGPGQAPRVEVDGAVVRVIWADDTVDELSLDIGELSPGAATEAGR
jgi:hypothetical protein